MEIIAGIVVLLSFLFIWTFPLWMPMNESEKFAWRIMQLPPEKREKVVAFIRYISLRLKAIEAKKKYEKHLRRLRKHEETMAHLDKSDSMTDNQSNG